MYETDYNPHPPTSPSFEESARQQQKHVSNNGQTIYLSFLVSLTTSSSPVAPNSFTRFLSTGYNLQIEKRTSTVNFLEKT